VVPNVIRKWKRNIISGFASEIITRCCTLLLCSGRFALAGTMYCIVLWKELYDKICSLKWLFNPHNSFQRCKDDEVNRLALLLDKNKLARNRNLNFQTNVIKSKLSATRFHLNKCFENKQCAKCLINRANQSPTARIQLER